MPRSARLAVVAGLLLVPLRWGTAAQAETPAAVTAAKAGVVWVIAATDDELKDGKVASGSGFLLLTRGLVMTNAHVVFDESGHVRTHVVAIAGGQQRGFGKLLGATPRAAGQVLLASAGLESLLRSRFLKTPGVDLDLDNRPGWLPAYSSASVVAYQREWDLAILVLDLPFGCSTTPLRLGNAEAVSTGSAVYAAGCPGADGDYAIAAGRVLAVGAPEAPSPTTEGKPTGEGALPAHTLLVPTALLETDLRVAEGFSGSPLLNDQGEVVGVLTFRLETQGRAFGGARLLVGADGLSAGLQELSRSSLDPELQDGTSFGTLKWRYGRPDPSLASRMIGRVWLLTVETDGTLYTSSQSGGIGALTSATGRAAESLLHPGWGEGIVENDAIGQAVYRSVFDELKAFCGSAGNLWPLYGWLPPELGGTEGVLASPYHWLVPYQGGMAVAVGRHHVARLLAGTWQWRKDFEGEDFVGRRPLVAGELLHVSGGKHLYALEDTGEVAWTYAARKDEELREPLRGPGGATLIKATSSSPDTGDRLCAIGADGKEKWTYDAAPGETLSSPQVDGSGRTYVLSGGIEGGYRTFTILAADGSVVQERNAGEEALFAACAPAPDGTVWVGDSAGGVYVWRPGTAPLVPRYPAQGLRSEEIIARKADALCILSAPGKPSTDGQSAALQTKVVSISLDGQKRWEWDVPDRMPFHTVAVGPDGTVALATRRYLYVFSPDRDRPYVCAPDQRAYYGPLVGPDGTVYVGTSVAVYAFGPPHGADVR